MELLPTRRRRKHRARTEASSRGARPDGSTKSSHGDAKGEAVEAGNAEEEEGEAASISCAFLCGDDSGAPDPAERLKQPKAELSTLPRIKWGRGKQQPRFTVKVDPGVRACWYCERLFQKDRAEYDGRKDCQKCLGGDHKKLLAWKAKRDKLIKRHGTGLKKVKGVKKQTLKQKTGRQQSLIPPKNPFLLYDIYVKKYGDPKDPKNKKRGHKVVEIDGIRGVSFPVPEDVPWELETRHVNETAHERTLMEQHSGDEEDFSDEMEEKFEELKQEEEDFLAKATKGITYDELMQEIVKEEEAKRAKEKEKAGAGDNGPAGRRPVRSYRLTG